jgi:hypothetical protein
MPRAGNVILNEQHTIHHDDQPDTTQHILLHTPHITIRRQRVHGHQHTLHARLTVGPFTFTLTMHHRTPPQR